MKTHLVHLGNSQGIRIPKPLLEQTGLKEEAEIFADDRSLVICSVKKPREGWASAFQAMAQSGDDILLHAVPPTLAAWDENEWEWR